MEFNFFIQKILSDLWLNIIVYLIFVGLYIALFWNRIWSIIDPLFLQVVSMASAAYCVYILTYYNLIKIDYTVSFLLTEISFIIGFFVVKNVKSESSRDYKDFNFNFNELEIFIWCAACIYFISQIVTFITIGFILFNEGTNHLFAFQEHSFLRVFLNYSRMIFLISVFYKKHIVGKFTMAEKLFVLFTVISTVLEGSKSALLNFFVVYFIVSFIYGKRTGMKIFKINKYLLLLLFLSAISIVSIQNRSGVASSLASLYYRFIGSGDIFVLGYNDKVIESIHEKSGFKYIFYPGIGTFLRLFTGMEAPHIIGVDITQYYTGKTDSGPNARHNFLGMIFWGYGGMIFSFVCGFLISWVRNKLIFFDRKNTQFIFFIIVAQLMWSVATLISDANLFMNNLVWSFVMLVIIYLLSTIVSAILLLKMNSNEGIGASI